MNQNQLTSQQSQTTGFQPQGGRLEQSIKRIEKDVHVLQQVEQHLARVTERLVGQQGSQGYFSQPMSQSFQNGTTWQQTEGAPIAHSLEYQSQQLEQITQRLQSYVQQLINT